MNASLPDAFSIDRPAELFRSVLMELDPAPTHVVINSGQWGLLDQDMFLDMVRTGNEFHLSHQTVFVWKTTAQYLPSSVCNSTQCPVSWRGTFGGPLFERELAIIRENQPAWRVWDLGRWQIPQRAFRDGMHIQEFWTSHWVRDFAINVLGCALPVRTVKGAVDYGWGVDS